MESDGGRVVESDGEWSRVIVESDGPESEHDHDDGERWRVMESGGDHEPSTEQGRHGLGLLLPQPEQRPDVYAEKSNAPHHDTSGLEDASDGVWQAPVSDGSDALTVSDGSAALTVSGAHLPRQGASA
eukprot:3933205-Rhodomonas_salina.2